MPMREINFVAAGHHEEVDLQFHFKGKLTQAEIDKLFTVDTLGFSDAVHAAVFPDYQWLRR